MTKPVVFISSSTEGLPIAEAVFNYLSMTTNAKLWTNQLFLPNSYPIEVLEKQLKETDFAVIIASPDDKLEKRGIVSPIMRDNLLLEFGLFAGALGRKRVFFLCPDQPEIDFPSELYGLIVAKYDSQRISSKLDEIAAAVQTSCSQLKSLILNEWSEIQKNNSQMTDKIQASEKGKILERMNTVITQIHTSIMSVQRDAFSTINDENSFSKVKALAIEKVNDIAVSFYNDASQIEISNELDNLVLVTKNAIDDLPFPSELMMDKHTAQQKILNTGFGALNSFIRGDNPLQNIQDSVTDETEGRIRVLKQKYMLWWEKHHPKIEDATFKLQSKLFKVALELAYAQRQTN